MRYHNMAYKDIQVILYRLAEQDRKLDAIHEQGLKTNSAWRDWRNGNPLSRVALPFSRFWSFLC